MSVTVKPERNRQPSRFLHTRSIRTFRCMARVLEVFCAIGSAVSLVAIAWQLIASGKVTDSFPIFLQWCTIFAIFAVIFHQAKEIFEAVSPGPSFPFQKVARNLRVIAALWLALVLIGLVFSILAAIIANGSFPTINVDLMPHGFPFPQTWYAAFEQPDISSVSHVVSIDLASAAIGALLWCLSYPLEFGGDIQEENELTA